MNSALHIGLVGPMPPPSGGMANQTQQLAERLRGEGATVSFVSTNAPYRPRWISHLPAIRAIFRLFPYVFALWRLAGRCNIIHVMANSGWSWHLFAAPAIWLAHLRGKPVLVNYHGGEAASFLARYGALVAFTMRHADTLAVPSQFLQKVFADFNIKAEILPNVVDINRFSSKSSKKAGTHLIVARNLELIYDNETALRAFHLVHQRWPDATLTIAGSGPDATRLNGLAAELGIAQAVFFAGRLEREQMSALFNAADIMLNPSLADNMPVSILEAWASRVAVISTNVGGIPYMVKDGVNALLVSPGDSVKMASAATRILEDQSFRKMLSEAGYMEVKSYAWESIFPILNQLYETATARRAATCTSKG